jgi:hypothetical protein
MALPYPERPQRRFVVFKSVEGIYRDGQIVLLETPDDIEEARVIVTFLPASGAVNLRERGIDESQAADLRLRLRAFTDDWDRPEMSAYDAL